MYYTGNFIVLRAIEYEKKRKHVEVGRGKFKLKRVYWLPLVDSNHDMLLQRQLSYH